MGTEFSACNTEEDPMNVISFMQSLSLLREFVLRSQNSSIFSEMFVLRLYPHAQRFVGQNRYFSKLIFACDGDTP